MGQPPKVVLLKKGKNTNDLAMFDTMTLCTHCTHHQQATILFRSSPKLLIRSSNNFSCIPTFNLL